MASQKARQFDELKVWLATKDESLRAFGRRARIDKSVLSRLVNGKLRRWDPQLVEKVSSATDGAVSLAAFSDFAQRLTPKPRRKRVAPTLREAAE